MEVKAALAYVRTSSGTVQLHKGDTVPDEADAEHVGQLTAAGVLGDPDPADTVDPDPVASSRRTSRRGGQDG